jgi:hypothetical protein
MTEEERIYYDDLLVRLKNAGADTFVFLNSDYFVLKKSTGYEVFFDETDPVLATVCADKAELFIFAMTHDDSLEENQNKYRELCYKALFKRVELGCSPKLWFLDSEKNAAAMERIEQDWGNMWEFLPILLKSEAEYEEFLQSTESGNEQNQVDWQEFSDLYLEIFGKPIDKDTFIK